MHGIAEYDMESEIILHEQEVSCQWMVLWWLVCTAYCISAAALSHQPQRK